MIRRLSTPTLLGDAPRRLGSAGAVAAAADHVPGIEDALSTEAYRQGYAEGFEAGESDGLREAGERTATIEEAAQCRLDELTQQRDALANLAGGLAEALRAHEASIEALAVELALASLGRALGQLSADRQLMQRLCAKVMEEFRGRATGIAVSAADRAHLPESIDGVAILVQAELAPGECHVLSERGRVESSVQMRLEAIYRAMLETLQVERP